MTDRPTLYFAGIAQVKHRGPGPLLTIMADKPKWFDGVGVVEAFTPTGEDEVRAMRQLVRRRKAGEPPEAWAEDLADYRGMLETRWARGLHGTHYHPGTLAFRATSAIRYGIEREADGTPARLRWLAPPEGTFPVPVGATLTCICKLEESRAGRCHRAWAARVAYAAGWRVVLDGEDFNPGAVRVPDKPAAVVFSQLALFPR